MHAIRSMNLQTILSFFLNHFIYGSRAKILARVAVLLTAPTIANAGISNDEVAGLIFLVPGTRVENVSERVEGQNTVTFGSGEWRRLSLKLSVLLMTRPDANWILDTMPSRYVLKRRVR